MTILLRRIAGCTKRQSLEALPKSDQKHVHEVSSLSSQLPTSRDEAKIAIVPNTFFALNRALRRDE